MSPLSDPTIFSRRSLLREASSGFGMMALAGLLGEQLRAETTAPPTQSPLAPKPPHFKPRAKHVIFLHMMGAPSQQDTFDYKPQLANDPWRKKFKQCGESGLWISQIYPQLADRHADDLCLLHGMYSDIPNHKSAAVLLHTGSLVQVRPSMGAWVLYGLGTENADLPGFIAMNMPSGEGGALNYGNAFLPSTFQGTPIGGLRRKIEPTDVKYVTNPVLPARMQRRQIDLARKLNERRQRADVENPELEGVIESFERAFRMQAAMPAVMNFRDEPQHILDLYGVGNTKPFKNYRNQNDTIDTFARQCLLARRMVEAGVRFVEITDSYWDHHSNQNQGLTARGRATDQPIAALLTDLRQRGLLDETLVVWGGEFGRKAGSAKIDGSEHNETGFTMWMAGGGVKGGFEHGRTNETGEVAIEGRMHIHDLHATILHILGLDHTKLTYRYAGRDFRLTDVHGQVVKEIMT